MILRLQCAVFFIQKIIQNLFCSKYLSIWVCMYDRTDLKSFSRSQYNWKKAVLPLTMHLDWVRFLYKYHFIYTSLFNLILFDIQWTSIFLN